MALANLTTLFATAKQRMLAQYKNATTFVADLGVLVDQETQQLENAFWAIIEQLDIEAAEGAWLDLLGKVVGEAREGADDAGYRWLIKARILANASGCTTDDILGVLVPLLQAIGTPSFTFVDWYPASMTLTVSAPQMGGQLGNYTLFRIARILADTKPGGVRLLFLYQDAEDSEMFAYGSSSGGVYVGGGFDDVAGTIGTAGRYAGAVKV